MRVEASVVVPVHNAEATLAACLQSLVDQDVDVSDVIVVDDGSTDGSAEIAETFVRRHPRVRLLRLDANVGPAEARNRGIRDAPGRVLLFVDADCVVQRDWARRHGAAQRHAGIVGGAVVGVHATAFGRADGYCSWFASIPGHAPGRRADHLPTANLSVARAVFERVGLFREGERLYSEDAEFCERAARGGEDIWYEPSIVVRHRDRDRLRDYLRHQWVAGIQMVNYRREPQAKYRWLMPRNRLTGWGLAFPLAAAYTALIVKAWWPHDRRVLAYAPLILAGKLAQSIAIARHGGMPSTAASAAPSLAPLGTRSGCRS